MTIQQCLYVIKIQKTGSFSEAARELFVAQSSLSASIKQLEEELSIKIFERSKNGVTLTLDGAEFVRYAAGIVESAEFISDRYGKRQTGSRLFVSTQHYDFVADVFARLVGENSEERFSFSLQEKTTYEVIRDVETATSDIGIIAIKDCDADIMKRHLQNKGVCFEPMLVAYPHVFVRRGHPLSRESLISLDALRVYPYLSYEQGEHSDPWFKEEIIGGIFLQRRVLISDRATLMNLLLETDAYTIGTGIMPSALNDGKIVSVPFEGDSFYRVGYLYKKDTQPSATMERFVELLTAFSQEIEGASAEKAR